MASANELFLMSEEFAHGIYKISLDGKRLKNMLGLKE